MGYRLLALVQDFSRDPYPQPPALSVWGSLLAVVLAAALLVHAWRRRP